MLDGNEQLSSYVSIANCEVCRQSEKVSRPLMPIFVNLEQRVSLNNIQSMIINNERSIRCRKCNEKMKCDREINSVIAVEVEPTNSKYSALHKLSDIQNEIILENKTYKLFGVIEFIASARHFVAHVKRMNNMWETYDDLDAKKSSRKFDDNYKNIFMLFYVYVK